MQVLGLDLSLTATGVALPDGTSYTIKLGAQYTIKLGAQWKGMDRLRRIRSEVFDAVAVHAVDLVAVEGYSYNSRNGGEKLGELGGVIRLALYDYGIDYVDVPPASLKKYATGKGNASKNEVLAAAVRRLGYDGADDNEADALWLRAMALDWYGTPAVAMPATHRDGLVKVAWPDIAPRQEIVA
jgi:Holliday junction resolvasome RuvABC endonuclease subunit